MKENEYKEIKGYYGSVKLDLVLPDRITFLYGDSGNGKTFLVMALSEQNIVSANFDYKSAKGEKREWLKDFIREKSGVLIIIDNADIVLDDELRGLILRDKKNQYIIVGRNPKDLGLAKHNFVDIKRIGDTISFKPKFPKRRI